MVLTERKNPLPDFTQYVPPGVFLGFDEPTTSVPVGVLPGTVAIIGPSVGYLTHSQTVALLGTDPINLEQLGIDVSSVQVTGSDGTVYTVEVDYTLTVDAGESGDIQNTVDNTTSITRLDSGAGGTIPDGATVFVSYNYTDASYTSPMEFSDFDEVQAQAGTPMDLSTGEITSPLSLAARFAFENGARDLVLVATPTAEVASRSELASAYSKISGRADVTIVVPLPVGITGTSEDSSEAASVGNDLSNHAFAATEDRYHRVGILGFDSGVDADPSSIAQEIDSARVTLAWPTRVEFYNSQIRRTQQIGGYYLAAAYAGRLVGQAVQLPLTRKRIRGFAGIPRVVRQSMSQSVKNTWSSNGVAVTEVDRSGNLVVRHGVTTATGSTHNRELNLVRSRDAMEMSIGQTVEAAGLIGSTIDSETSARVKGIIQGSLEQSVSLGTIVDYVNLRVRQLDTDPTVIEAKFAYRPSYPLNYVTVVYSVDVSTGEVSESIVAAT